MTSQQKTRERYFLVDGLRGIAAIAIAARHISQHTLTPLFANGRLAADIFIFAGGFMTAYAYQSKLNSNLSMKRFALIRLARLYPLFIIGWVLGCINLFLKIHYEQSTFSFADGVTSALLNLLWLPYFSNESVDIVIEKTVGAVFPGNDPAWTLSLIFWSALLYGFLATRKAKMAILAVALMSGVGLAAFVRTHYMAAPGWGTSNFIGGVPRTLFCFFGGVILCLYWENIKKLIPSIKAPHILLPLITLALLAIPNFPGYYLVWLATVFTLVPLLVALAIASRINNKVLQSLCSELGKLSYPIYCIHYPIFSIYSTFKPNNNLAPIEIFLLVTCTVGFSYLLSRYFDTPISRYASKLRL